MGHCCALYFRSHHTQWTSVQKCIMCWTLCSWNGCPVWSHPEINLQRGSSVCLSSALLPMCQRQWYKFRETDHISDVYFRDFTDWYVELCLCDLPFRTKAAGSQTEGRCLGGEVTGPKTDLPLLILDSLIQQRLKSPLFFSPLLLFLSTGHSSLPPHFPEMDSNLYFLLVVHRHWLCPHPLSDCLQCCIRLPSPLCSYFVHAETVASVPRPGLTYLLSYFLTLPQSVVKHWV